MKKAETKTEQMVYYQQIWVAHYIAPSYLEELLKGAKEQHSNFVESHNEDTLGVAYILANGDRFVIVRTTDKKHPENSYNVYDYQRKVK